MAYIKNLVNHEDDKQLLIYSNHFKLYGILIK